MISVLAGGLIIYDWFHRRPEQSVPAWVIEDVVIGSAQSPLSAGITGIVANDSSALPPGSRQSGEVTDPGHVLVDVNTAEQRELIRLPGIGPARRKAILTHFGSPERFLAASRDELEAVPGLPAKVARGVYAFVHRFGQAPLGEI